MSPGDAIGWDGANRSCYVCADREMKVMAGQAWRRIACGMPELSKPGIVIEVNFASGAAHQLGLNQMTTYIEKQTGSLRSFYEFSEWHSVTFSPQVTDQAAPLIKPELLHGASEVSQIDRVFEWGHYAIGIHAVL